VIQRLSQCVGHVSEMGKQEIFTILMGKYVEKVTTWMIKNKLEDNKRRNT